MTERNWAGGPSGVAPGLLLPPGIAQVQKKIGTSTQTATPTVTLDATPVQNNLLVSAIGKNASAGQTLTPPTGWTMVTGLPLDVTGDATTPWSGILVGVAYKVAGAGESTSVAWASANSFGLLAAFEFSGLTTSSPLDKTAVANNNTSVTSLAVGPTATTTVAAELAVAAWAVNSGTSGPSIDNSFTLETASGSRLIFGWKLLSATGTVSATASWTTGSVAVGAIATFKGA